MIKFKCPNCDHRIGAPDDYAGKKARCSKCKEPVRIPAAAIPAIEPPQKPVADAPLHLADDDFFGQDLAALAAGDAVETERPTPQNEQRFMPDARRATSMEESKPQRKLPWPIDVLLYPTSMAGIFCILFVVIGHAISVFGGILGFLFRILLTLYAYWYFCECIRDSSDGGLRAPNAFAEKLDIYDEIVQYIKVAATCIFFIGPAIIYYVYCGFNEVEPSKPLFFSMVVYGITFFPMGVLAMVLFDSLQALNPWLLIRSIISTFPQYIGLVLIFYGLSGGYYFLMEKMQEGSAVSEPATGLGAMLVSAMIYKFVSSITLLWLVITLCHLLGRFYYKNEEKLYWEV